MAAMGGRPVLLQRFPHGAGGPSFFQKRVPEKRPAWLETTIVATPNGTTSQALVAADLAHVLWAVNLACLGFHVWPYRADDPEHADELRIDLDPTPGVDFEMVREAAHEVDGLLRGSGPHRLAEDHRQPGHPRVRPSAAPVVVDRGAGRGRGGGPGAGATPARPDHRGVVEGGAGPAGVRRFQPERPPQDRLRRLVGAGPPGRPGVGALPRGTELAGIHPDELTMDTVVARCRGRRATPGRAAMPQSLEPLLDLSRRDAAAGLPDAPWPPVYPKMPGEPPRVAPSRARKQPRPARVSAAGLPAEGCRFAGAMLDFDTKVA